MNLDGLPLMEFAFPGPLRDRLVAAVLAGAKTTTSGLLAEYERGGEPLPEAGQVLAVVDSAGLGDPGFTVNDDTLVVAERFRLVVRAGHRGP